mmetsp:Transcript_5280/g.6450  ORF Transcript_5280/g.6450 Transcript_5280/m.6450 type:complete len:183 (-) Transcript_5280:153-701(-)
MEDVSIFHHWFVGANASLLGCLLAGISLSRMANSRTKSFVSKVRILQCVLATMFTIALLGSALLLLVQKLELRYGLIQVMIFVTQLGISSNFVTISVSVLILVTSNHRLKLFAVLTTLNLVAYFIIPVLIQFSELAGHQTECLIACSALGIILSLLISNKHAQETNYGEVISETVTESGFNF